MIVTQELLDMFGEALPRKCAKQAAQLIVETNYLRVC
jgi:hypothetical protein